MNVSKIIDKFYTDKIGIEIVCGDIENTNIENAYVCDLLSEVMAHVGKAGMWITVQSHSNIVAVAAITGIKCILLVNGREYNSDTIDKAKEEGIVLLKSKKDAFTLSGKMYEMLQC